MADLQVKALVLRRADYGDYDRMVSLLTPDSGRIDAIARGCRRSKSQLMNATEPFTSGEYQLFSRGERYEIRQCAILESFFELRSDLARLTHGAYWLRLLDAVASPGTDCRELFAYALRALAFLNYSDTPPEMLTLGFEARVLLIAGFPPRVSSCARCGRKIEGDAAFSPREGGAVCAACEPGARTVSAGALRILEKTPRAALRNMGLLETRPEWMEAARLMRDYIAHQISLPQKFQPPLP